MHSLNTSFHVAPRGVLVSHAQQERPLPLPGIVQSKTTFSVRNHPESKSSRKHISSLFDPTPGKKDREPKTYHLCCILYRLVFRRYIIRDIFRDFLLEILIFLSSCCSSNGRRNTSMLLTFNSLLKEGAAYIVQSSTWDKPTRLFEPTRGYSLIKTKHTSKSRNSHFMLQCGTHYYRDR